jgi:hypothetical protein
MQLKADRLQMEDVPASTPPPSPTFEFVWAYLVYLVEPTVENINLIADVFHLLPWLKGDRTNEHRTWNESCINRHISTSFLPFLDPFLSPWHRRLWLQIQTIMSRKYTINTSTLLSQKKTCLVANYTVSIPRWIIPQSPTLSLRTQSIGSWAVYFLSP